MRCAARTTATRRPSKPAGAQRGHEQREQQPLDVVALAALVAAVLEHARRCVARLPPDARARRLDALERALDAALPRADAVTMVRLALGPVDGCAPSSVDADLDVIALHVRDLELYAARGANVGPLQAALRAVARALAESTEGR